MSDWPLAIPPAVETEIKFRIQIFKKSDWANREVLPEMIGRTVKLHSALQSPGAAVARCLFHSPSSFRPNLPNRDPHDGRHNFWLLIYFSFWVSRGGAVFLFLLISNILWLTSLSANIFAFHFFVFLRRCCNMFCLISISSWLKVRNSRSLVTMSTGSTS